MHAEALFRRALISLPEVRLSKKVIGGNYVKVSIRVSLTLWVQDLLKEEYRKYRNGKKSSYKNFPLARKSS